MGVFNDRDNCTQCGHNAGKHVLVGTGDSPLDGGVRLCPVSECLCYSTWSVMGRPVQRVPDGVEVSQLRRNVQAT